MEEEGHPKALDQAQQSTIALYYNELLADFKNNEQAIYKKLENLQKQASSKKDSGNMNDAVDSTEAIRQWEDHMWDL